MLVHFCDKNQDRFIEDHQFETSFQKLLQSAEIVLLYHLGNLILRDIYFVGVVHQLLAINEIISDDFEVSCLDIMVGVVVGRVFISVCLF